MILKSLIDSPPKPSLPITLKSWIPLPAGAFAVMIKFPEESVLYLIQLGSSVPSVVVKLRVIGSPSPSLNVDFEMVYV